MARAAKDNKMFDEKKREAIKMNMKEKVAKAGTVFSPSEQSKAKRIQGYVAGGKMPAAVGKAQVKSLIKDKRGDKTASISSKMQSIVGVREQSSLTEKVANAKGKIVKGLTKSVMPVKAPKVHTITDPKAAREAVKPYTNPKYAEKIAAILKKASLGKALAVGALGAGTIAGGAVLATKAKKVVGDYTKKRNEAMSRIGKK